MFSDLSWTLYHLFPPSPLRISTLTLILVKQRQ
jgi:hypothetical protein